MNTIIRLLLASLGIALLLSAVALIQLMTINSHLKDENVALANESESLKRALTTKYPEIDTTLPNIILNIDVADGASDAWTTVSITSSKMRDDCPAVSTRFIRDHLNLEHQVTESTRSETASV